MHNSRIFKLSTLFLLLDIFCPRHLVPLYQNINYDKCTVKNSLELAHFIEKIVEMAQNYLRHSEYDSYLQLKHMKCVRTCSQTTGNRHAYLIR